MTSEQAYETLGLVAPVTAQDVKLAYRRKAMELHPDRFSGDSEKAYYARRFMAAHEAYKTLRERGFPELASEPLPEPDFGPKLAGRSFAPTETADDMALTEKLGVGLPWRLETMLAWGLGLPLAAGTLFYFVKMVLDAIKGP